MVWADDRIVTLGEGVETGCGVREESRVCVGRGERFADGEGSEFSGTVCGIERGGEEIQAWFDGVCSVILLPSPCTSL